MQHVVGLVSFTRILPTCVVHRTNSIKTHFIYDSILSTIQTNVMIYKAGDHTNNDQSYSAIHSASLHLLSV